MFCLEMPRSDFPFLLRDGIAWQFDRRQMQWKRLVGSRSDGYRVASWNDTEGHRRWQKVHRIVWELHHGPIPPNLEIDHINGVKDDNRIENLRAVSHQRNIQAARERLGNWQRSRKITPEQQAELISMPSTTNFRAVADAWGMSKGRLLSIRSRAKRAR